MTSNAAHLAISVLGARAKSLLTELARLGGAHTFTASTHAWPPALSPPTPAELSRLAPLMTSTAKAGAATVALTLLGREVAAALSAQQTEIPATCTTSEERPRPILSRGLGAVGRLDLDRPGRGRMGR